MRHQTKVRKEAHLIPEFTPMDKMRLPTTPTPRGNEQAAHERVPGRKAAGPANDKGAGAETWDSEGLGNMASGKRSAQTTSQHFLRAIQRRGCNGLFSPDRKQPCHEGGYHSPCPDPKPTTQSHSFLGPRYLMQWFTQRKQPVPSCWKHCTFVFWVDLPSRKGTSIENWVHLSYQFPTL